MIEITKNEATYLRKVIPNVHITRTTHKWYAEEVKSAEAALRELNRTQRTISNFEI